jgi:hypothetical protein
VTAHQQRTDDDIPRMTGAAAAGRGIAEGCALEHENALLRESHARLLASLQWALRRIDASGLGMGEHFAKASDALATAENLRL